MSDKGYLNLGRVVDLQILKKTSLIIFSLLLFSGCLSTKDKIIIDKPLLLENTLQIKKKKPNCKKNIKIMNYALSYVLSEFEKGYFKNKDILGAKAQLFLIDNKSKSVFAQNINAAENSYTLEYQKAKKKKCSVRKFELTPLQKIKNVLNQK